MAPHFINYITDPFHSVAQVQDRIKVHHTNNSPNTNNMDIIPIITQFKDHAGTGTITDSHPNHILNPVVRPITVTHTPLGQVQQAGNGNESGMM